MPTGAKAITPNGRLNSVPCIRRKQPVWQGALLAPLISDVPPLPCAAFPTRHPSCMPPLPQGTPPASQPSHAPPLPRAAGAARARAREGVAAPAAGAGRGAVSGGHVCQGGQEAQGVGARGFGVVWRCGGRDGGRSSCGGKEARRLGPQRFWSRIHGGCNCASVVAWWPHLRRLKVRRHHPAARPVPSLLALLPPPHTHTPPRLRPKNLFTECHRPERTSCQECRIPCNALW
eukprot:358917-Chlamydomonas_euryale.AAC.1